MANIVLASMSLVCTVIVVNFYHHSPMTGPPKWLKVVAHKFLVPILRMRRVDDAKAVKMANGGDGNLLGDSRTTDPDVESEGPDMKLKQNGTPGESADHQSTATLLAALTRSVVDRQGEEETRSTIHSEWTSIGAVFDRLFFVLFLAATMAVAVVMLGIYPLFAAAKVEPIRNS